LMPYANRVLEVENGIVTEKKDFKNHE
jgi:hypothetical protein